MPVRFRITLLFTLLVAVILTLVCASIYYFSYNLRASTIKVKLANKAVSTGNLLNLSNFFSNELVRKIDSSTLLGYRHKVIQAYDYKNNKIYEYRDNSRDTFRIRPEILNEARVNGEVFFTVGKREAIAYYYTDIDSQVVMVAAGDDVDGKENLRHLLLILAFTYVGGLVIAAFGGYLFSKNLLTPIIKISNEVNHISAQNLSNRLKTGAIKDEWHYLANTLNSLLNRLQESFDMQKRFIANASHELSTPLTSISSQLEVSLQRERDAAAYRKVMKSVHQDVLQMSKLTRTLLDFAKAAGTQAGIEITAVRVDEVLLRLPAEMSKINYACSVAFEFEEMPPEENQLLVYGNEELLFTAIKNIVINACKYSEQAAKVKLHIQHEAVQITVEDNGKGIPAEELEHIFEPFYRAQEKKTNDGFGLGLSLASRIIKLHKGKIKVTSQVDKGSAFTIWLPVANNKTAKPSFEK
ncbi:MAG: HAMP domain-containing histidine kinase [Bacteroidota bacterium]|nr:HAMP domain-containing histidine kinase [Bacteroidota bacterium]